MKNTKSLILIVVSFCLFSAQFETASAVQCCWGDITITTSGEGDLTKTYVPATHTNAPNAKRDAIYTAPGEESIELQVIAIANANALPEDEFEASATVSGAEIKGECSCTGGDSEEDPPNKQFNVQLTRHFVWSNEGDAGNWNPLTDGYTNAQGDGDIDITTTSGGSTDSEDAGECEGVKTENDGASWIPALSIKWNLVEITPTLTWDSAADTKNTWLDDESKLNGYNKTVSNVVGTTKYSSVYASATLGAVAFAKTTDNAIKAEIDLTVKITSFEMTSIGG